MRIFDPTFVPALDLERDSFADEPTAEATFTVAQRFARFSMTLAIALGMSALFATQIYATLR